MYESVRGGAVEIPFKGIPRNKHQSIQTDFFYTLPVYNLKQIKCWIKYNVQKHTLSIILIVKYNSILQI